MVKRILIGGVVVLALLVAMAAYMVNSATTKRVPGHTFDSAGVKIFYTDEGPRDAAPVVLIHGFGINADLQWRNSGVAQELAKDYRVITLDNRGHGLSDKPHEKEKYGIEMANDVIRLLDHLKIAKANVIGYSMGGFITMRLIASYPDRLITAMPCGAGWNKPEGENLKLLMSLADSLEQGGGFDVLARRLEPGGNPSAVQIASMNYFLSKINDKAALAALIRGFEGLAVTEEEIRVNTVPVLSVVGSVDPLRDGVDAMKDVMGNLKTLYIDGDNHMNTPHDKRYLTAVREFLAEKNGAMEQASTPIRPTLPVAVSAQPALAGS